jgi:hypothetical protein
MRGSTDIHSLDRIIYVLIGWVAECALSGVSLTRWKRNNHAYLHAQDRLES